MRSLRLLSCLFAVMAFCSTATAQDRALLFDPEWIEEQVIEHGIDFVIRAYPPNLGESEERVHQALDLSRHVLRDHPEYTRRQLQARLVAYSDDPNLAAFQELPTDDGVQLRSIWPSFDQAGGPLVRMIDPISRQFDTISISADGARVAIGSINEIAEVYDLESTRYVASIIDRVEGRGTSRWSFTSDLRLGLHAHTGGRMALWNLENEELILEFQSAEPQFHFVMSGDGRRALSAGLPRPDSDEPVCIYNLDSGEQEGVLETGPVHAASLQISEDGTVAATASGGGIEIWDVGARQQIHVFQLEEPETPAFTMTPDGGRLTAFWKDAVRVYDLRAGTLIAEFAHESEIVYSRYGRNISTSTDGRYVGTRGFNAEGAIQLWDTETRQLLGSIKGKYGRDVIAVADDGHTVITESGEFFDARINLWDMRRADLDLAGGSPGGNVTLSHNGELCAFESPEGTIDVFRCETGELHRRLERDGEAPRSILFSHDNQLILSQMSVPWRETETLGGRIDGWNVDTGELAFSWTPAPEFTMLRSWGDGNILCSSNAGELEIWDPLQTELIARLPNPPEGDARSTSRVTPDGTRLVVVEEDGKVEVLELSTGDVLRKFSVDTPFNITFGAIGASNSTLVIDDDVSQGDLHVWYLETGERLQTLHPHEYRVGSIAVSADGRYVVSLGRSDCELRLWDVQSGECLGQTVVDEIGPLRISDDCSRIIVDPPGPRAHLFAVENLPPRGDEADGAGSQ